MIEKKIEEEQRYLARQERKKQKSANWCKAVLLAIPKNLVYIFVGIVFFAFAAMCYITYTEKDLQ